MTRRSLAYVALALVIVIVTVGLAACRDGGPTNARPAATTAANATPAPSEAQAAYYRAELRGGDTPCVHGRPCRATLHLEATGGYHVNEEYPFRFVPEAAPGVSFAAEQALRHDDAQHGTLEVEFTPAAAGTATVAGLFKLSVCSASACQIERPRLGLSVRVE
jgi:hypothetical protein